MASRSTTVALLRCGLLGPALLTIVSVLDGATRDGYDPWRHWVSHLSLGERGWLGTVNLLASGVLVVGFSFGLRRVLIAGRGATWGPRLVAALGAGLILSGLFPIDPGLGYPPAVAPPAAPTWRGQIHDLAGAIVFGTLTAAAFVLARRLPTDSWGRWWCSVSRLAGAVVIIAFIACSALVALDYAGVVPGAPSGALERIALYAGCGWLIALAGGLLRELRAEAVASMQDVVGNPVSAAGGE